MKNEKQPDLAQLQTDVALLKQFNEKVVEPTLKSINAKLDSMQFVQITTFEEHKDDVEKRFDEHRSFVEEKFRELKKSGFIRNTLAGLFGAVITLLATNLISNIINK